MVAAPPVPAVRGVGQIDVQVDEAVGLVQRDVPPNAAGAVADVDVLAEPALTAGISAPVVLDVVLVAGLQAAEVEQHLRGAAFEVLHVLGDGAVVVVRVEPEGRLARPARVDVEGLDLVRSRDRGLDVQIRVDANAAGELVDGDVPVHIAGTAVGVPLVLLLALPVAVDVLAPLQRVVVTSRQVCQGPVELRRSGADDQVLVLVQVDPCPVELVLESDVPAIHAVHVRVDVLVAEGVPSRDSAHGLDFDPDVDVARELVDGHVPVAVFEELVVVHVVGVAAVYVLASAVEVDVVVRAVVQRAEVPEHRRGAALERGVVIH